MFKNLGLARRRRKLAFQPDPQALESRQMLAIDLGAIPQLPATARVGTGVRDLASFSFTTGSVADYTGSISWGDGTTTEARIVEGAAGIGFVLGGHTYLDSGSDIISVSVSGRGESATASGTIQVSGSGSSSGSGSGTGSGSGSGSGYGSGSGSGYGSGSGSGSGGGVSLKGVVLAPVQGQAAVTTLAVIVGASSSTASSFSGTVAWGDGTTSSVTVIASPTNNGQFLVTGSHAYATVGTFATSITVNGSAGVYTAAGKSLVAAPSFTATTSTVAAAVGQPWSGVVATVTAADPAVSAGNLIATIDWGDGRVTPGLVAANASSGFDVIGTNVYGAAGSFPISVRISDLVGSTALAAGTASVVGMPLNAYGQPLSLTAGANFSGLVASVINPNSGAQASQMTATINWGDGTTSSGTIAADSAGGGKFNISGSKKYSKPGKYTVTVQVADQAGGQATATSTAIVIGAPLTATGKNASATEGAQFAGAVASFSVPNTSASASDFTATIWWGDGVATTGTIVGSGGQFDVTGTHTYSASGAYAIGIQIGDGNGAGVVAQGKVTVADAALSVTGRTIAASEGSTFNGVVASFVDANPTSNAQQFKAVITWGDGQVSLGQVVVDPAGGGRYSVMGSNLYTTTGSFATSVQVTGIGGTSASGAGTANVSASSLVVAPPSFYATKDLAFSGSVAAFTKSGAYTAGNFTATINWGDGTSSSGTISSAGTPGQFIVSGSHTYTAVGSYAPSATVTLTGAGGGSSSATGSASVSNTTAAATSAAATAGASWSGTAATFSTTELSLGASSFGATIDWGDGTSSAGVVASTGSSGQFKVTGTHTYAIAGAFTATVRITDPAGRIASAVMPVAVADAAVSVSAVAPSMTEGTAFSGTLATFTGGNAQAGASYFGATIRWGDGTTSVGIISATTTPGQFKVAGEHTYDRWGSYPVTVQVISQGGSNGAASASAAVAKAPVAVQAVPVSTLTGAPFSGLVATFTGAPARPASEFAATINWGDGTSSAGTVVASPQGGPFQVKGSHTYAAAGSYTVSIQVVDSGGAPQVASGTARAANIAGSVADAYPIAGTPFANTIATFTGPGASASGTTATITWGDGSTTAGTITADPASPGTFHVAGSHSYATVGRKAVSVRITNSAGTIDLVGSATVLAAPLLISPSPFNATAGAAFNGEVARFRGGSGVLVGATATIAWGDGSTSAGTIVAAAEPGGPNRIIGSHTYASTGTYNVAVTFAQPDGTSASSAASVKVTNMAVSGAALSLAEGATFDGVVASFTNAGSGLGSSSYKAIIDWGDGRVTAGTVANNPAGGGKLDIKGSIAYASPGQKAIAIQVVDPSGRVTTIHASANVSAAVIAASGAAVAATRGTTFTGTVATFTSTNPRPDLSGFDATINWGDGSTTAGTIMADPVVPGRYLVIGSHTYLANGSFPVSVQIARAGGASANASAAATVAAAAVDVSFAGVQALAGTAFSGAVATFAAWPGAAAGGFTATIDWGDGTTSAGIVMAPATSGAPFSVNGSHTYATSGIYRVKVTVGGAAQGTASGDANVASVTVTAANLTSVVGAAFSGTVANFGAPAGGGSALDFRAVIDWGDGSTSPGIVAAVGASFSVSGTHAYAAVGSYPTTVRIFQPSGASVQVGGVATVVAAPLVLTAVPSTSTAGIAFAGPVVTFVGGSGALSGVTATINWGDGTTSAGTIAGPATPGGPNGVSGTHTYASIGSYSVTVTLVDAVAGVTRTITGSASVSDVTATGKSMYDATEGSSFTGTVATFTSTNSSLTASSFTATIDWGDGQTSAGTISANYYGGGFSVSGSHAYALAGSYKPTVRIVEPGGYAATAAGSLRVLNASTSLSGSTVPAAPGVVFSGTIATLMDGNSLASASEYAASISWSDGVTTSGAVVPDPSYAGRFFIKASRVFDLPGSYAAAVTVVNAAGVATNGSGWANVVAPALSATVVPIKATASTAFSGLVARITADATTAASALAVTINWGDGATSPGIVTAPASPGGPYLVTGEHTYAANGSYNVAVSVTGPTGTTSSSATATVSSLSVSAAAVAATAGAGFSGTVASFVDTNPAATSGSIAATIDWGDGQTSAGRIVPSPTSPGVYDVVGDHTYARFGAYTTSISVSDNIGSGSASGTASIADAAVGANGATLSMTEGASTAITVATFLSQAPGATAADFSASIDWGDGQVSAGTVVANPGGGGYYDVVASHAYKAAGSMAVGVTILSIGGSKGSATSSIAVTDAPIAVTGANIAPTEGSNFSGVVATFVDANRFSVASDFSATIDWGDGTSTAGKVTGDAANGYTVTGTQTYRSAGTLPIAVQIKGAGGGAVVARSTAVVADAPLTLGAQITPPKPTEGEQYTGIFATFTDANPYGTASSFTATINWGDGTTSGGTVSANSAGGFDVSATHTYARAGYYSVGVQIASSGGSSLNSSATVRVADAPLTGVEQSLKSVQGSAFSGLVASFVDADPNGVASRYTATINWGDGTTSSGTIAASPNRFGTFDVSGSHTYAYATTYPVTVSVTSADGQTVQVGSTMAVSSTNAVAGTVFQAAAGAVNVGMNGAGNTNTASFDLGVGSFVPLVLASTNGSGGGSSPGGEYAGGSLAVTAGAAAPVSKNYSQSFTIHQVGPDYVLDQVVTVAFSQVVAGNSFSQTFTLTTQSHYHQGQSTAMGGYLFSSIYDEMVSTTNVMKAAGTFTVVAGKVSIAGSYSTTESTSSSWMLAQSTGGVAVGIGAVGSSSSFYLASGTNTTTSADAGSYTITDTSASIAGGATASQATTSTYSTVRNGTLTAPGNISVTNLSTTSGSASQGFTASSFYARSGGSSTVAGMATATLNGSDNSMTLAIQTGDGFGMATGTANASYTGNSVSSFSRMGSVSTSSKSSNLSINSGGSSNVMLSGPFTQGNSSGTFTYSGSNSVSNSIKVTDSLIAAGGISIGSTIVTAGSNESNSSSFSSTGSYSSGYDSGMFTNSSSEQNSTGSGSTQSISTVNGVQNVSGSYSSSSDGNFTSSSSVDGTYGSAGNSGSFSQTSFNMGSSAGTASGGFSSGPGSSTESGSSSSVSTLTSSGTYSGSSISTSSSGDGYGGTTTSVVNSNQDSGGTSSSNTIEASSFGASNSDYSSSGNSSTAYNGSSSSSGSSSGTTVISNGMGSTENIAFESSGSGDGTYSGTESVAFSASPGHTSTSGNYSQNSSGGGVSSYTATNRYSTVPVGSAMGSGSASSSGGTYTYAATTFSTYDQSAQGSFGDSGESGSYTSNTASNGIVTTSDVGSNASISLRSGSISRYSTNSSQKSAGTSSTAGTYTPAGNSGTTSTAQAQNGVATSSDGSTSWSLNLPTNGSVTIGGSASASSSSSEITTKGSSQNTVHFSPSGNSGSYSSNQTQHSQSNGSGVSVGAWFGWSQKQFSTSSVSQTSETFLTYQDAGTFNGAGSTGNSSFTSVNTTTSNSLDSSNYIDGSVSGNNTSTSSGTTFTNASQSNAYSPGSSTGKFSQIEVSSSESSNKGIKTSLNGNVIVFTWDEMGNSSGVSTTSGTTTGGITTQTRTGTSTNESTNKYSETDAPPGGSGSGAGNTKNSSRSSEDYNKSTSSSKATSTIGASGNAIEYSTSASVSSTQSYSYTSSLSNTSTSSDSSSTTKSSNSSTEKITYNTKREATTTSSGGEGRVGSSSTSFSNSKSLTQNTSDTNSHSSSLTQAGTTTWLETSESQSSVFTYSYSNSGSSQGGGSSQWTTTGSVNQTTSQSTTASASGSKSTQYTTTASGPIDPNTGMPTPTTLTIATKATATATYNDDSNDVISGAIGSETRTKTTNSGSTDSLNITRSGYGSNDTTLQESTSQSSQTLTYSNSSHSGSVNGGGSSSWKTTINGSVTSGPDTQPPPYSYTLSNSYSPSGGGEAPDQGGGGGTPLLERLNLGENPTAAFFFGLFQGGANAVNGITAIAGSGDWSRGAFVYESDGAHSLSKNVGGQAALTLLMGGMGGTTLIAKLGCILNNPVVKGIAIGIGAISAGEHMGQFAGAVANGDGYGAVEHGILGMMDLIDLAAAFGQSCFAAGTPILTDEGPRPIEEIRAGDRVLAAPEHDPDATPSYRLVEQTFQTYSPVMELRVGGRTILTTAEHPFWVQGKGWTDAQQLEAGDLLRDHDGRWHAVEEAGTPRGSAPVYNMRVSDYHTYFVGGTEWGFSVWAHNAYYQRVGVSNDLAQEALAFRRGLRNPLTGRNVMVFEYVTADGTLATKALLSNGRHTERMIDEGTKVMRIFTERQPCTNCFNYIERTFPTTEVYYLFPYMNKSTRMPTYAIQSFFGRIFGLIGP